MTGLLTEAPLDHPAVAVKIPNLQKENPHLGLNQADIVVLEPNGYAYTRVCAIFHSQFPKAAGPTRSMRPVDVPLLAPLRPLLANTGASDWVSNYLAAHDEFIERMYYLSYKGTPGYSLDESRVYQVGGKRQYDRAIMAHPAELVKLAKRFTAPPEPYFPIQAEGASTLDGEAGTKASISYGGSVTMSYAYDPDRGVYLRSQPWGPHLLADGEQVITDSIMIIKTRWWDDKIWEGSGVKVPYVDIIKAEGEFCYLNGGKSVTGTWRKGEVQERFEFQTADGQPLVMAPGRTWVELPQPTAKVSWG